MAGHRRGLFISFEGVEGSGKSTQIVRLAGWLRREGRRVVVTREPGGTPVGERLRRLLLYKGRLEMTMPAEMLVFMAARAELASSVIRPALARGAVVICDRFLDATVAYQGYAGGLDVREIQRIGRLATGGLRPDLTLLLDVDPAKGLRRVRGARDRIERRHLAFHQRVRRGYRAIARSDAQRVVVIDGAADAASVARSVRLVVATRLVRRRR